MMAFFALITAGTESFAISDGDIKATEQIKKNPAAMDILKKIEMSKKILSEMQQTKKIHDMKAAKIAEARKQAQASLDAELSRMGKQYEPYNAKNAFERFVAKKPSETHQVFWAMFNYQQDKIKSAKAAKEQVLSGGGTWQQALDAYYKESALKRVKMIEMNKHYNVKYASSDAATQQAFDENGKLPRSD